MIGVFGGTFDPPHIGHRILAIEAMHQLALSRVLWAPTADPPHKPEAPMSAIDLRVAMVELTIRGEPRFELSRIDIDRPGPHFAVDTLRLLAGSSAGPELAYLMGGDSLRDLPSWHTPNEFVAHCVLLAVMPRPEFEFDLPSLERAVPGLTSKVRFIQAPAVVLSASDIRSRVREGAPYAHLLPEGVEAFIERHGLYR